MKLANSINNKMHSNSFKGIIRLSSNTLIITKINSINIPDITAVKAFFLTLQDKLCQQFEHVDNKAKFAEHNWQHKPKGGGRSRILNTLHNF